MLHNTYRLCENVIKQQLKYASKSRTTLLLLLRCYLRSLLVFLGAISQRSFTEIDIGALYKKTFYRFVWSF